MRASERERKERERKEREHAHVHYTLWNFGMDIIPCCLHDVSLIFIFSFLRFYFILFSFFGLGFFSFHELCIRYLCWLSYGFAAAAVILLPAIVRENQHVKIRAAFFLNNFFHSFVLPLQKECMWIPCDSVLLIKSLAHIHHLHHIIIIIMVLFVVSIVALFKKLW